MLKHVSKKKTDDFHNDKSMCDDFIYFITKILVLNNKMCHINNNYVLTTVLFLCFYIFSPGDDPLRKKHVAIITTSTVLLIKNTCADCNIFNILEVKLNNQLTWHGHVQRMAEGRVPKIALKWMPKQKRARGRPKQNWMEGIKKPMNKRNINEGQWEDRKQWSLVVGQHRKMF
jgi:hypothetical protein